MTSQSIIDRLVKDSPEQTFIDRLVTEQRELTTKLEALMKFIRSDKFSTLSNTEQKLLIQQRRFMNQYENVLEERINLYI